MLRRLQSILLMALMLFGCSVADVNAESYSVIVNTANNEEIDMAKVTDIYLGNLKNWADGSEIVIVLYKATKEEYHNDFSKKVSKRKANQLRNKWKKIVFTGAGRSPKIVGSEKDVFDIVSGDKGAIGYVSSPFLEANKSKKIKILAQ